MNTELDTAVAVEVMGWHLINEDTTPPGDENGDPAEGGPEWRTPDDKWTGRYTWNWMPSVDIAAAWEVVDAMRAQGYHFRLESLSHTTGWLAEFTANRLSGNTVQGTLAMAICWAAINIKHMEAANA